MRSLVFALLLAASGCVSSAKTQDADPFVTAFASLKPSVVLLSMRAPSDDPKMHGKIDDAFGSGVVVASGDWGSEVLTAQHVVDRATNLRATVDERRAFAAHVIAADRKGDLALLCIDARRLKVARLGKSQHLEPGTLIGVAGYPIPDAFADEGLGVRTSVFSGRLSSIRADALELDVPVIPGESGGPVFEARSASVIGIAQSRFDDEPAIGFAVPVEDAQRLLNAHAARLPALCAAWVKRTRVNSKA